MLQFSVAQTGINWKVALRLSAPKFSPPSLSQSQFYPKTELKWSVRHGCNKVLKLFYQGWFPIEYGLSQHKCCKYADSPWSRCWVRLSLCVSSLRVTVHQPRCGVNLSRFIVAFSQADARMFTQSGMCPQWSASPLRVLRHYKTFNQNDRMACLWR